MKTPKPKGKSNVKKKGRGGPRPGSGRKPNAAKAALKVIETDHIHAAEDCFNILVAIAKSDVGAGAVRVQAAMYVCNRVWGSPKQAVTLEGKAIDRLLLAPPVREPPPGVGPKA